MNISNYNIKSHIRGFDLPLSLLCCINRCEKGRCDICFLNVFKFSSIVKQICKKGKENG